jgi:hypothetical protein
MFYNWEVQNDLPSKTACNQLTWHSCGTCCGQVKAQGLKKVFCVGPWECIWALIKLIIVQQINCNRKYSIWTMFPLHYNYWISCTYKIVVILTQFQIFFFIRNILQKIYFWIICPYKTDECNKQNIHLSSDINLRVNWWMALQWTVTLVL